MRDADGQRLQLKSKLLVGAASMTAAAMSTAAFAADAAPPAADTSATPSTAPVVAPAATPAQAMQPIDPPKWLPYVDIGGGVGSGFAVGRATAFVPVMQDTDSLLFARVGVSTRTHYSGNFNIGAGYRTKIDSDWILGAFAGFDSSQTENNNTFNQFSFGVEAMSADWDVRANAYFAKKKNRAIDDKFTLYIHDTTIALLQAQEGALSGFDGEVGYRVFNTDNTDVRVFAGAYTFHHADVNTGGIGANFSFPYRDIEGPKLRAEVNVFDLDMLGAQSRFSVEGQISHDNVNHTSEYIGATLRLALNDNSGSGAQALDDLDRRMADPVRRNDNVLTQWQFNKPEPVVIYNSKITSQPTNTFYYAEQRSGTGAGTYADQTTIQDATSRGGAGKNAFIVLTDAGGSVIDASGTTVLSGETVTGAGTFKIRGANNPGVVFTRDFAPGSGPVSLGTSSSNVLEIKGDANIANLSLVGPFVNGIYGTNVGNVNISNVTIDGGGAGTNGMVFKQTDTSGTANIAIANSTIKGVTNDGVDLNVGQTAGTSTTNLTFSNGKITAGNHGVDVVSSASGAAYATVYAGIHDSTLTTGGVGAEMTGTTAGSATLVQSLLVDPTTIHANGNYGIYVHANIHSGSLTQNLTIDDVTIAGSGTTFGGLAVFGEASGGHLTQNVNADNLTVAETESPVLLTARGKHGAHVDQVNTLSNLRVDNATYSGIFLGAIGYGGAAVNQTTTLENVHASHAGESGLQAHAYATTGATVIQTISASHLTAVHEGENGVDVTAGALGTSGAPSIVAQYVTIDGASLSHNAEDGVYAGVYAYDNAVARQDLNLLNATIGNNDRGIEVNGYAFDGASSQQNIYFAYDVIQHNARDGVDIHVQASNGNGFATQYGSIYSVDASYNGEDGFNIGALAYKANAEQQFYMVDVTGDHEGRNGLSVSANAAGYTAGSYANYPSHVQQNVYAIYGSFSHNARNGVSVNNFINGGAALDQYVFLYGLDINRNAQYGVSQVSYASGSLTALPTHLYANLQVVDSTVDRNAQSGIYVYSKSIGSTNQRSHTTISGSDVSHNGYDGFDSLAFSAGYYSTNLQYVSISGSTFDHNVNDGAYFLAQDIYGPGSYGFAGQIVTISGSDFSHNGYNGVFALSDASGYNGRAEQYFTIQSSNFSNNVGNGFYVNNYAHDGIYNGYSCFDVQGTAGGCAIVRSAVVAIDSNFNDNGYNGVLVNNYANYLGTIYSKSGHASYPSVYLAGSQLNGNGEYGLALGNILKYGSASLQTVDIVGTDISHNGRSGIAGYNMLKYGSQQYQSVTILGSTIENNAENGIYIRTASKYSPFQVNTLEVDGSSVSNNGASGVYIETTAKYVGSGAPPPPTGVFYQSFAANGSMFDNNVQQGVILEAAASNFIYAYQFVQTQNSDFSGNGAAASNKYGLAATMFSLHNVYGGQYVYSQNDAFTHNSGSGMLVGLNTIANYYAPTSQVVQINGDHFDNNDFSGLKIEGEAKYGTAQLYQQITIADTKFNTNGANGLYIHGYATDGAVLTRLAHIYSYNATTSASGNGAAGIAIYDESRDSAQGVYTQNTIEGVTLNHNSDAGLLLTSYATASGNTQQYNAVYGNTASGNYVGISLNANGPNAAQESLVGGNTAKNNTSYGIYGSASNGANQTVHVYVLGNTVSGNNISDYGFASSGGSTQTVN